MIINVLRVELSHVLRHTTFEGKTYFVGGCVRDHLINRESNDFDVFVNLPGGAIKFAEYLSSTGAASWPSVYENTGIVSVDLAGKKLEISSPPDGPDFSEVYSDERDDFLRGDALRRDFSMNSLFMKVDSGEILDISGLGMQDIEDKLIRCTSHPGKTFEADPLRMLRAVRFAAELDFRIEEATWTEICSSASKICQTATQRISGELDKIILSPFAEAGFRLLQQSGLLACIIPELERAKNFAQNEFHNMDLFDHSVSVMQKCSPDATLRWSALLHDLGKTDTLSIDDDNRRHFYRHEVTSSELAESILLRLKYPVSQIKRIQTLIRHHMAFKDAGPEGKGVTDRHLRKLTDKLGDDIYLLLDLVHADSMSHSSGHTKPNLAPVLRNRVNRCRDEMNKARFPLSGKDIIARLALKPGPRIGQLLETAREKWYEDPSITTDELLEYLHESIGETEAK